MSKLGGDKVWGRAKSGAAFLLFSHLMGPLRMQNAAGHMPGTPSPANDCKHAVDSVFPLFSSSHYIALSPGQLQAQGSLTSVSDLSRLLTLCRWLDTWLLTEAGAYQRPGDEDVRPLRTMGPSPLSEANLRVFRLDPCAVLRRLSDQRTADVSHGPC